MTLREIEFSVMVPSPGQEEPLLPLLHAFEQKHGIHVRLRGITWSEGWHEISSFALYGQGPDISEIGFGWIGSLASMNVIRPFAPYEINAIGGKEIFFPGVWSASFLSGDDRPWCIPWMGDPILVYYWKDALEKTDITDPRSAFSRHAAFVETLNKLRDQGYRYPLALTIKHNYRPLHEAIAWMWEAGCELIAPDLKQAIFAESNGLAGLRNYFSLIEFMDPEIHEAPLFHGFFEQKRAVVTLGGPRVAVYDRHHNDWGNQIGTATQLGKAFVGGSSLAIWNYSRHKQECTELIRFLLSQTPNINVSPHATLLPVRQDIFQKKQVLTDAIDDVCIQAMQQGGIFPTIRRWGFIEEKLSQTIAAIWADLFSNPDQNLDSCILKHLEPLARRVNRNLSDS